MSIGAVARRVRAYGGQFLLLAALTAVVTLLISGVPRAVNRLAEQGLREQLAAAPPAQRDLTYSTEPLTAANNGTSLIEAQQRELATLQSQMPPIVGDLVDQRWFVADGEPGRLTGPDLAAQKLLVDLVPRAMPGVEESGTLVDGRWPQSGAAGQPLQMALADDVARKLNLRVGSRLRLASLQRLAGGPPTAITVVGVFQPHDRAAGIWDTLPQTLRVTEPRGDGEPFDAVGVVHPAALDQQAAAGWPTRFSWRYRLGVDGLDARRLDQLIDGIGEMSRTAPERQSLVQGVDVPLRAFAAALASARTILAVVGVGVLATLAGLVVLAATLAVRRRRHEFVLLRARGGAAAAGVRRSLAESLLVVLPAAAIGWLLGGLVPGPSGNTLPVAVAATVLLTSALPVAALVVGTGATGRSDLIRLRPTARRVLVEVCLLLLAGLAVVLLRRRGLTLGELDPLLLSVPVLLAVAAAVVALRAYPWPLRLASRLAARTRGSVAFLGTARAGRSVAATPLVVVVLAIATAAFCAVVAAGVETSRDRAATRSVPADALIQGDRLAADTGARLEELPGVSAAAAVAYQPGQRLLTDASGTDAQLGVATVLLVDGPALQRLARQSGTDVSVPEALLTPRGPGGPVPALVSPALAADLAHEGLDGSAFIGIQSLRYEFRVAETVADFPLLGPETNRFVILPWQALPERSNAPAPTGFLVAGDDLDTETLRRVGDEGQSRFQNSGTVTGGERPLGVEVLTWEQARRQVGGGGVNGLLVFAFVAGAAGGTVLGLLAIAFTVLAGARARGQVLSRLRTLGLSRRQWRGLLLVELAPLVGVAVLTGAVVGALLPLLLTPLLGLSAFTSGIPVRVAFEPGLVAAVVVLGAVALGFAIAVEALNNRRLRLGEVLRLGEET
ncbi:FtsX-like permease family protein [Micromonospora sp. NPDC051006]|uniref:FtsX-like permease family protein n=1 Tax=Micromonospora sp. NPDC051006 TaxID=3364283 RepID=UPI0037B6EEE8